MRIAAGIFGLLCGLIVVVLVGRYGYKTTENEFDAWTVAFLFGVIASFGLAGHIAAVRLWSYRRPASLLVGAIALVALCLNMSNSLGAIVNRAGTANAEAIAHNREIRSAEAERDRLHGLIGGRRWMRAKRPSATPRGRRTPSAAPPGEGAATSVASARKS